MCVCVCHKYNIFARLCPRSVKLSPVVVAVVSLLRTALLRGYDIVGGDRNEYASPYFEGPRLFRRRMLPCVLTLLIVVREDAHISVNGLLEE